MCFSATASFTAGAALVAVGTVTGCRSQGRTELPLALVPLLFGVQQISEGVLWLTVTRDLPNVPAWATNTFSFLSHAIWPIFVPFAILLVETSRRRRQALQVFVGLGLVVGLYLLFFLFREPLTASVQGRSTVYDSPHFYLGAVLVLYRLATCVSGCSPVTRCVNAFGVLALVLAAAAYLVSVRTFVSVWCFFAVALCGLILVHFSGSRRGRRHVSGGPRNEVRA